ncbi:MAG: response regulator transcription factor [Spirochaetales bacterium]
MNEGTTGVRRVALFDDHGIVREGIKSILLGLKDVQVVAESGNVADFLSQVRACAFDLALVDISTSEESDGVTLARQLKTTFPGSLVAAVTQLLAGQRYISSEVAHVLVTVWQSETLLFTERERRVLDGLFRGRINKEIALELGLSVKVVEKCRSALMKKSGTRTATELSAWAIREGHVEL